MPNKRYVWTILAEHYSPDGSMESTSLYVVSSWKKATDLIKTKFGIDEPIPLRNWYRAEGRDQDGDTVMVAVRHSIVK